MTTMRLYATPQQQHRPAARRGQRIITFGLSALLFMTLPPHSLPADELPVAEVSVAVPPTPVADLSEMGPLQPQNDPAKSVKATHEKTVSPQLAFLADMVVKPCKTTHVTPVAATPDAVQQQPKNHATRQTATPERLAAPDRKQAQPLPAIGRDVFIRQPTADEPSVPDKDQFILADLQQIQKPSTSCKKSPATTHKPVTPPGIFLVKAIETPVNAEDMEVPPQAQQEPTASQPEQPDNDKAENNAAAKTTDAPDAVVRSIHIPEVLSSLQLQSGTPVGQDGAFELEKRIAELRAQTRPEFVQTRQVKMSAEERIESDYEALAVPLTDRWTLNMMQALERFELDPATDENDLKARSIRTTVQAVFAPTDRVRFTADICGYTGENQRGVGGELSGQWVGPGRMLLGLSMFADMPWTDNTLIVRHGGKNSGGDLSLSIPVLERLTLSGQAKADWYAGSNEPGGEREWMARGYSFSSRLDVAILRSENRVMGTGFLEPQLSYENPVATELSAYAAAEFHRIEQRERFTAFTTTPRSEDLRAGLNGTVALSDRIGLQGGGFLGQDDERDIAWNALYGWNARLVLQPVGSLRLWGQYETVSESNTGLNDGKSRTISMGMNVQF